MGAIVLNLGELNQHASQIKSLIDEVTKMQGDIKSTVNELDRKSAGKRAKHASDVMFSCYSKGQKVSAGLTEIQQIVKDAEELFLETDRDMAGNMVQIYTDPEHTKEFFNKERAKVKKEVNSDFVEIKSQANKTEARTFTRERPKSLWDRIKSVGKSIGKFFCDHWQDILNVGLSIAGVVVAVTGIGLVATIGLPAVISGLAVTGAVGGLSCLDLYGDISGHNPLKDLLGNKAYNYIEGGLALLSLAVNPTAALTKVETVTEMGDVVKMTKGRVFLNDTMSLGKSSLKALRSGTSEDILSGWQKVKSSYGAIEGDAGTLFGTVKKPLKVAYNAGIKGSKACYTYVANTYNELKNGIRTIDFSSGASKFVDAVKDAKDFIRDTSRDMYNMGVNQSRTYYNYMARTYSELNNGMGAPRPYTIFMNSFDGIRNGMRTVDFSNGASKFVDSVKDAKDFIRDTSKDIYNMGARKSRIYYNFMTRAYSVFNNGMGAPRPYNIIMNSCDGIRNGMRTVDFSNEASKLMNVVRNTGNFVRDVSKGVNGVVKTAIDSGVGQVESDWATLENLGTSN